MESDKFTILQKCLLKIDRGHSQPKMPGPVGIFLRRYASKSKQFVNMATDMGIAVNKNGEIPGDSIGPVSLFPLTGLMPPNPGSYHFGDFISYTVICPELLCLTELRIWVSAGSGSATQNILESLMTNEAGVSLTGGFGWKPPVRITPGTSTPTVLKDTTGRPCNDYWDIFPFLRYFGEDIKTDPHPLEYRTIETKTERLFASVRVTGGLMDQSNILKVPYVRANRASNIRLSTSSYTTERGIIAMSEGKISSFLLVREPEDEGWTVLDSIESSPENLLLQLIEWHEYTASLTNISLPFDERSVIPMARSSLSGIGIETTETETRINPQFNIDSFAKSLSCVIRFSSNTAGSKNVL